MSSYATTSAALSTKAKLLREKQGIPKRESVVKVLMPLKSQKFEQIDNPNVQSGKVEKKLDVRKCPMGNDCKYHGEYTHDTRSSFTKPFNHLKTCLGKGDVDVVLEKYYEELGRVRANAALRSLSGSTKRLSQVLLVASSSVAGAAASDQHQQYNFERRTSERTSLRGGMMEHIDNLDSWTEESIFTYVNGSKKTTESVQDATESNTDSDKLGIDLEEPENSESERHGLRGGMMEHINYLDSWTEETIFAHQAGKVTSEDEAKKVNESARDRTKPGTDTKKTPTLRGLRGVE